MSGFVFRGGQVLRDEGLDRLDLVIGADGRIAGLVAANASVPGVDSEVDVRGRVLLPGLINAHSHGYGQLCRVEPDAALEAWMPRAQAVATGMTPEAHAVAATLNALDNLRHGATTTLDHATLTPATAPAIVDAYEAVGTRVVLAVQTADRDHAGLVPPQQEAARRRASALEPVVSPPPAAECVRLTAEVLDRVESASGRVSAVVGPSAPERCSDALLAGLAALADERGVGVHTHLLETKLQREHDDPVGRLAEFGLLHRRTTVAHAVHVTPRDRAALAAAGSTVVHDPLCNLLLGSGRAAVVELLADGVDVALATDGWSTGGAQDVLLEARLALALMRPETPAERWLRPADIWPMLTSAAARAVDLPGVVGTVSAGAAADVLVVDPVRAGWLPSVDPLLQLVLGGLGTGLSRVYVAGREVWRDGEALTVDTERLVRDAQRHLPLPTPGALARAADVSALFSELDRTVRA